MLHVWWWFNQNFYHNAGPLLPCTHSPSQTMAKIIYFLPQILSSLRITWDTSIFFSLFVLYIILFMMVCVSVLSHIPYTTLVCLTSAGQWDSVAWSSATLSMLNVKINLSSIVLCMLLQRWCEVCLLQVLCSYWVGIEFYAVYYYKFDDVHRYE